MSDKLYPDNHPQVNAFLQELTALCKKHNMIALPTDDNQVSYRHPMQIVPLTPNREKYLVNQTCFDTEDFPVNEEKNRVYVKPSQWRKEEFTVFAGHENMDVAVFTGSLEHANQIKDSYLATGLYHDPTPPPKTITHDKLLVIAKEMFHKYPDWRSAVIQLVSNALDSPFNTIAKTLAQ